jgi:hypothetical protein
MSNRAITPHCAWAIAAARARQLPPLLRWLIVTIAERVDRNTLQWWSSIEAMMSDTGLSRRQVQYLIRDLPPDLIAVRRGVNGRWVLTLLRPAVDPEAHTPERGAHCAPLDPPRGAQHAPYPLKEDITPEGKEGSAPASPTPPAPSASPVFSTDPGEGKAAPAPRSRIVTAAPPKRTRTPLPDDWQLSREERQMVLDGGHDPDEVGADIRDWAAETGARSADWGATTRRWIRRERTFTRRPATPARGEKLGWLADRMEARFNAHTAAEARS